MHHISLARPVCLLLDGHSSHIDLETSKFCEANQILLYCLPPHTSHILQPLDVGVIGPMKATWKHAVAAYQHDNIGSFITKRHFSMVFRSAYHNAIKLSTIINAFKHSGIYPVNRAVIDAYKFAPSKPYKTLIESPKQLKTDSSAALVLKALEELIDTDMKQTFLQRYEEGYDLQNDTLYIAWQNLKKKVQPALQDITNSQPQPSKSSIPACRIHPEISNLLHIPTVSREPKKTGNRGTANLPKHLSGEEMIRILEEKRANKIEEKENKERRRVERERLRKRKRKKKRFRGNERERKRK